MDEIISPKPCPFCPMFAKTRKDIIDIEPLNPVTHGHRLVIPREHVSDFTTDPEVTARVMKYASDLAFEMGGHMNLITSRGSDATQSVWHLHVHLVPRRYKDGLKLPWTDQVKTEQ